jgi:hypothetical protein
MGDGAALPGCQKQLLILSVHPAGPAGRFFRDIGSSFGHWSGPSGCGKNFVYSISRCGHGAAALGPDWAPAGPNCDVCL